MKKVINKIKKICVPVWGEGFTSFVEKVEGIVGKMRMIYSIEPFSDEGFVFNIEDDPFDEKEWKTFLNKLLETKVVKTKSELGLGQHKTDKTHFSVFPLEILTRVTR
jgi:hypothetical protein